MAEKDQMHYPDKEEILTWDNKKCGEMIEKWGAVRQANEARYYNLLSEYKSMKSEVDQIYASTRSRLNTLGQWDEPKHNLEELQYKVKAQIDEVKKINIDADKDEMNSIVNILKAVNFISNPNMNNYDLKEIQKAVLGDKYGDAVLKYGTDEQKQEEAAKRGIVEYPLHRMNIHNHHKLLLLVKRQQFKFYKQCIKE